MSRKDTLENWFEFGLDLITLQDKHNIQKCMYIVGTAKYICTCCETGQKKTCYKLAFLPISEAYGDL